MNANCSCLFALLLAPGAMLADHLSFANGDLLTGAITAIDDQGRFVVETPVAPAPLILRSDGLSFAEFDHSPPAEVSDQERVNLINGDVLPGTVTAIGAKEIALQTWFAGDLRVPRGQVRSIDFGIAPSKLVYQGPGGPEGWLDNDEWRFSNHRIMSTGRGTVSRPKVLPDNFILRFQLSWVNSPSFRFYFCDDHLKDNGQADRYYLDINKGGLQLRRQSTDSNLSYYSLYSSKRLPSSFDNNDVEIELRVDRTRRLLYIYIDGELEGRYPDRIANTPTGKGIMLYSSSGNDAKNIVSAIEIFEWDAVSQLHRAEGHEDPTRDAIITTDSQRYPGDAQEMVTENDQRVIILKNPHADDLLRVPVERTSVLYLRQEGATTPFEADFGIDLADKGLLHLSEPRLQGATLSGRHPLLGEITVKRSALRRIQATESDSTDS